MSDTVQKVEFSEDTVFVMRGKVVMRKIGDDTLLVPVSGPAAGGRVFPVNDSALIVWQRLTDEGTLRSAVDALVGMYGIEREEALTDCRECVATFLDEGLIGKK